MLPSPSSIHPDRKKNRLAEFDYSSQGYYFVTICVKERVECFGEVKNGTMILNKLGEIVEKYLKQIPEHYKNIAVDEFVVMPNHIHLIINIKMGGGTIRVTGIAGLTGTNGLTGITGSSGATGSTGVRSTDVGTEQCSVPTSVDRPVHRPVGVVVPVLPVNQPVPTVGLLSKIIKSFKEVCTKNTKNEFGTQEFVWQRSFYDHIIRNIDSYKKIRFYIQDNPMKWDQDRNNLPNLYM